jgi:glycosyltransferase 2 family protein
LKFSPTSFTQSANLKTILRAVIVVVIIGLLVNLLIAFLLDSQMIFQALKRVSIVLLIVPFLSYLLTYFVDSLRLRLILSQFGYKVPFADRFRNSVIGGFFSNLTPLASGGQPFQVYHLQTVGVDLKISTNIILSRFVEYVLTSLVILAVSLRYALAFTASIGAGRYVMYVGFAISLFFGLVFLGILVRPDILGKTVLVFEKSRIGRLVSRLIKRDGWGEAFIAWCDRLRDEVYFLWTEKLHIMLLDIVLGLVNLVLQVFSLQYVVHALTSTSIHFIKFFVTFVIANLVVYYVPTPGASGSVEGIYSLVFSGLTGHPDSTFVSVVIWRVATYYLHIFFGLVLFTLYMKKAQSTPRAAGAPDDKEPKGLDGDSIQ